MRLNRTCRTSFDRDGEDQIVPDKVSVRSKNKIEHAIEVSRGDHLTQNDTALFDDGIIKKMNGNTIPFDSTSFDYVINNQVMEHVKNLDTVLTEIQRVLKSDGVVVSLFPH